MRIAVEADTLANGVKTGVHYYVRNLLEATLLLDSKNYYDLFYFEQNGQSIPNLPSAKSHLTEFPIKKLPRKAYNLSLRSPFGLPIDYFYKQPADLFFFPNFVRWPLTQKTPSVVVIYDTAYLDFPEAMKTRHHRAYLQRAVPRSIERATQVVAISESTKRSLMKHYDAPAEKITVITPAVDHTIFKPAKPEAIARVKEKYNIKGDYLYYLGSQEPRKNIIGIIRAYASLPAQMQQKYQLVIAGGESWNDQEIISEMSKLAKDRLVQIGFLPEPDAPALYSGATLFIYPSIFEGWGMQVLEAQACGAPVLTADNSSLPEAGGAAAKYVKTADQADLNAKLSNLLTDKTTLTRMKADGFVHAQKFNWETSAQKLLAVFEAAVGPGHK